jgi:hypothetical protein
MSLANLVRRMTEAGAPPEAIAIALEEIEAIQSSLDARRHAERDRKRAQRERQKSANVTGQSEDSHGTVTDMSAHRVSLDKETSPRPPKEINPIPCVRETRARAKHPLPPNWRPASLKPDGQAGRIVAAKPVGWMERQLSKFKDHALQNNRLCSDWDAAWRNWIKEADEIDERRRPNTLGRNQPSDGLSNTARAALQVFGR